MSITVPSSGIKGDGFGLTVLLCLGFRVQWYWPVKVRGHCVSNAPCRTVSRVDVLLPTDCHWQPGIHPWWPDKRRSLTQSQLTLTFGSDWYIRTVWLCILISRPVIGVYGDTTFLISYRQLDVTRLVKPHPVPSTLWFSNLVLSFRGRKFSMCSVPTKKVSVQELSWSTPPWLSYRSCRSSESQIPLSLQESVYRLKTLLWTRFPNCVGGRFISIFPWIRPSVLWQTSVSLEKILTTRGRLTGVCTVKNKNKLFTFVDSKIIDPWNKSIDVSFFVN